MQARKKPLLVDYRRVLDPEFVTTAHGRVRAEVGDFVMTNPRTGDTWPIKPDIFAETYDLVE